MKIFRINPFSYLESVLLIFFIYFNVIIKIKREEIDYNLMET